jgi:hypothetical protein
LRVTAADEQDRAQVSELAKRVQEETGQTVESAFVDQGYTGENVADAAEGRRVKLEVAPLPTSKRDFVLLPSPMDGRTKLWLDISLSPLGA